MGFPKKWKNSSTTRTYYAWRSMRTRCLSPLSAQFQNYGGRGITVCERWVNDYDAFFDDMGEVPEGLTLDRIDVNSGYTPENCRWADWDTQRNNKRTNVVISDNGVTKTVTQWAREIGLNPGTLHKRVDQKVGGDILSPLSLRRQWSHGTRNGYETGCRCAECRSAHAAHHRAARARRKLKAACGGELASR